MKINIKDLARIVGQVNKKIEAAVEESLPEISEIIASSIEENFRVGGRWDGNGNMITLHSGGDVRWKPLAESTKKQYKKKGLKPERTLQRTAGGLASSIEVRPLGRGRISTSAKKVYARIQNLGGETRPGNKIPASPYLVLQLQDIEDIQEVITRNLK